MSWDWEKLKEQQKRQNATPPQLDDVIQKLSEFKKPGGGGSLIVLVLVILGLIGYSTFYTIGIDEVGMVQRFGAFVRKSEPGPNFKIPLIEKVTRVKVKRVYKKEFGFRSDRVTEVSRFDRRETHAGGSDRVTTLMLTGDLNVALVPWIVQYRIDDPFAYLFKIRDPEKLLEDMAEAAMCLVIGDRSINEVITKRKEIAEECIVILQKELDNAASGISVRTIEMEKTNVPVPVQPSFNEVNQALQEKETLIYQANEDYNRAIPAARGEAERTIRTGEGYAIDRVNRAEGDSQRFSALYEEYRNAREITRSRLYLETMTLVLPKMGRKFIIDSDQENFLPLLNLGKGDAIVK